ncbi:MAG TPA: thiamine pyrophosphate-binding protein, partial [Nakamurella sp.]|nr:thiamine pyrophosphate-binding protein [Nakamurella sp.]
MLVQTLVAFGVRHVFGMVGHSNLGFADALRRAEQRGEISYVGIRHEGAAAFAASAYGKLTGRPALCQAIAGPGLDQSADRAVRRQARPVAGARDLRPGRVEGAGAR